MAGKPLAEGARKGGEFLSESALVDAGSFRLPNLQRRPERRLVEDIVFEIGGTGAGLKVVVPAGYITDGFSMPGMLLQLFQPRSPRFILPAILHDWLYDEGLVPRDLCDRILLQAMRAVGASRWQRFLVYRAVRLGGKAGYNRPCPINLGIVASARDPGAREALLTYLKTRREL